MKILRYVLPFLVLFIAACGDDDAGPNIEAGLEEGLVAHIPFDGNAANLASGVSGTLNGGVEFTADRQGNVGSAILLDGVDDYAKFPHDPSYNFSKNQEFTLSLWVMPDEQVELGNTDNDIISKWCDGSGACGGYPFTVRVTNSSNLDRLENSLYAAKYTGSCRVSSRVDIEDSLSMRFHHVLFLKKSTQISLYIDGVLTERIGDMTGDVADCDTQSTAPMLVGARNRNTASNTNWFKGAVDEFRIYNRALSEEEIAWLSNN